MKIIAEPAGALSCLTMPMSALESSHIRRCWIVSLMTARDTGETTITWVHIGEIPSHDSQSATHLSVVEFIEVRLPVLNRNNRQNGGRGWSNPCGSRRSEIPASINRESMRTAPPSTGNSNTMEQPPVSGRSCMMHFLGIGLKNTQFLVGFLLDAGAFLSWGSLPRMRTCRCRQEILRLHQLSIYRDDAIDSG